MVHKNMKYNVETMLNMVQKTIQKKHRKNFKYGAKKRLKCFAEAKLQTIISHFNMLMLIDVNINNRNSCRFKL